MANSKGNQYPIWFISNNFQVFAGDSQGTPHQMSDTNFAMQITVSEDGTVWILSTKPDPDGGGASIYYCNGDGNWVEITTADPGGVTIAGGPSDSCFYLDGLGTLRSLSTNGVTSEISTSLPYLIEMDYGGGYFWVIAPEKEGGIPCLQYATYTSGQPLSFTAFNGQVSPYSISVNYQGDCCGTTDFSPMVYPKDGSSPFSAGSGANGKALQMSFKNWNFLLSTDANYDGNLIMEWQDDNGGTFMNTEFRAARIASTYYQKS